MYSVSDSYKESMRKAVQRFDISGTIGDASFERENILAGAFQITNQCSDNTNVQIGTVYIGELSATFINVDVPRYSWMGKEIIPYFGRYTEADPLNPEKIPLGVFNVTEAQWTAAGIVVKAYDNMAKLDKPCTVSSAQGMPFALASMACSNCGLRLGTTEAEFSKFTNGSVQMAMFTENDVDTWRDFMSWLGQTLACFVYAGRDGRIYFRSYDQEVVDTVDSQNRFIGASFSDYETRYTGLSCVNIAEKTTSYYSIDGDDDGLTYNLGSNPFLQYGVNATQDAMRTSILRALQSIKYVPFKVQMIGDPAYDLGDVLSFPEGLGDGEKLYCITKYTWTFNGSYEAEGVGENPALMNAKSKTDKNLEGLLSGQDDNGMHYTHFTNVDDVDVGDGEHKQIMLIRFICQKQTHVAIEMQMNLEAFTTEDGDADEGWINNDAVGRFTYYVDGEEITTIYPRHTWQDGEYNFRLRYDLSAVEASIHNWEVWCNMNGGGFHIDPYYMNVTIMGQGIVADDFNGTIQASDIIKPTDFTQIAGKFMDGFELTVNTPLGAAAIEKRKPDNFTWIFNKFTESAGVDGTIMVFRPVTNQDKVTATATVSSGIWIGSGTIFEDNPAYVQTWGMHGITGVKTVSSNCEFLVSTDYGDTWIGHTESGWIQDAYMTKLEIEAVTPDEWAELGSTVVIKAILEQDATLASLNVDGAYITIQEDN
ncbi:MAG: hypothetical protein IJ225_10520 [Solobacterium sp.]|nr:hypothetical protein [Solobacterium sp.]